MSIQYEIKFRPNFERQMSTSWMLAAVSAPALMVVAHAVVLPELPSLPFYAAAALALGVGARRAFQAYHHHLRLARLGERPLWEITPDAARRLFSAWKEKNKVWLGSGFKWDINEAQNALDYVKCNKDALVPESSEGKDVMGAPWIHGMGETEETIAVPLDHLAGHMLVVGTTRAGKTRFLEMLVAQAVMRDEAVFIIDPKGDRGLLEIARNACELAGAPERFVYFHPAFPKKSCRINPLHNYNNTMEIASRIAALMPPSKDNDTFTAFCQSAVNNVVTGLISRGERPTLVNIRSYLEGGLEELVINAVEAYCDRHKPSWRAECKITDPAPKKKVGVLTDYYMAKIKPHWPSPDIEGLIKMQKHEQEHFQKMITGLLPKLAALTAGDVGPLLSPSAMDPDDTRPITHSARIIKSGQVFYLGLNSLSDGFVGSAIGSIMLADLTAVAGARYNYEKNPRRVNVFIDEAAEVMNDPCIQMLNKSGGAGFVLTLATQTFADFEKRVGNAAAARMILGNLNNIVALRTIDTETQEEITKKLEEVRLKTLRRDVGSTSGEDVMEISRTARKTIADELSQLIAPQLLGKLPNGEYFAILSGGKVFKGRLPRLKEVVPDGGPDALLGEVVNANIPEESQAA